MDKEMLVIEPYEILVNDMVANKLIRQEPVFAEYKPVSVEYAFKVKNNLEGAPAVISTRDQPICGRKEYAKEVVGKLLQSVLSNFISQKTVIG